MVEKRVEGKTIRNRQESNTIGTYDVSTIDGESETEGIAERRA
jgi:hypothetical protein